MNSSGFSFPALRRSFCSCSRCLTNCSILSCLFCLNACFSSFAFLTFSSSATVALSAWRACDSRVCLKASLSSFSISISWLSLDCRSCFCQLPFAAGLSPWRVGVVWPNGVANAWLILPFEASKSLNRLIYKFCNSHYTYKPQLTNSSSLSPNVKVILLAGFWRSLLAPFVAFYFESSVGPNCPPKRPGGA